jgi:copper chaperone CopZ
MIETKLTVEGMACSMCEAHVNDAIRKNFPVKRVKSNRRKKTCMIKSLEPLDEEAVKKVITDLGYEVTSFSVLI